MYGFMSFAEQVSNLCGNTVDIATAETLNFILIILCILSVAGAGIVVIKIALKTRKALIENITEVEDSEPVESVETVLDTPESVVDIPDVDYEKSNASYEDFPGIVSNIGGNKAKDNAGKGEASTESENDLSASPQYDASIATGEPNLTEAKNNLPEREARSVASGNAKSLTVNDEADEMPPEIPPERK